MRELQRPAGGRERRDMEQPFKRWAALVETFGTKPENDPEKTGKAKRDSRSRSSGKAADGRSGDQAAEDTAQQ